MSPVICTKNLGIGYDSTIVSNINITVDMGQIAVLIGKNGTGKTTLIKTLSGIINSKSGEIYLGDTEMSKVSYSDRAKYIATVLTEKSFADYTCEEMVSMGRYPYTNSFGVLSDEDKEKVRQAMIYTDTMELKNRSFLKISDGQRQRVLLARAICQEPKLLLLDEPTSFLDVKYKIEFLRLLRNLSKEMGFAVIMSLHELDMSKQIGDLIICMDDNKIDRIGRPEEIFKDGYIKKLFDIKEGDFDEKSGLGII